MKAIQTRYKGYHFRSRLEARWAVFFDSLGIIWEYEPEGFELPGGIRYLPDFFLPKFNGGIGCFVEVKSDIDYNFKKAALLGKTRGIDVLFLQGTPECTSYNMFDAYRPDRVASFCFNDKYLPGGSHGNEYRIFGGPAIREDYSREYNPNVYNAVVAARSARFEHGESGAS